MTKTTWTPIGALSFYLAGISLVGIALGLALKAALPYLVGPAAIALILRPLLPGSYVFLTALCGGLTWMILLQMARSSLKSRKSLTWHQGHYRAALLVLCLGLPHWRRRSRAAVEAGEEPTAQTKG